MRLSLGQKIGWTTTALSAGVTAVIGIIAFLSARDRLETDVRTVLEAQATLLVQRAELSLAQIDNELRVLAQNPLFSSAFADDSGRRTFLEPFIRGLDLSNAIPVRISVHDAWGVPLAWSANESAPKDVSGAAWVDDVIQGTSRSLVDPVVTDGTPGLVLAWPLPGPVGGAANGFIMARMNLQAVLESDIFQSRLSPSIALRTEGGALLARTGHRHNPADGLIEVERRLQLPASFSGLGLTIFVSESIDHAVQPLMDLLPRFAVIGFVLMTITAWLSLRLGHRLAARIVSLSAATREMANAAEGRGQNFFRGDEVDELAAGFALMKARVDANRESLETIVADRTAELRRTAEDLEAARERLNLVIAGTGVGIWDWNPQTGAVVFNERWAEIIGYSLADLQPISIETWIAYAHPDDLKESASALEEVFAGKRDLYSVDARMRHRDGSWVWVRDTGRVMARDDEGRVTRMVGTHLDITTEKSYLDRLVSYRNQLEAILAAAPDGIMTVDEGLTITQFNPAAEAVFGWTAAEILGRPLSVLLPNDLIGRHGDLARRFFTDQPGLRRQMAGWRTVDGRRRDGSAVPLLVTLSLTELDGKPVAVAAVKDVSVIETQKAELRTLAQQLSEQLALAQEANRAKSRFLAAMSHELRTPLNAIIGFSELVASDTQRRITPEKREEYAADVARAGAHLLSLINDLLDLARIEENKIDLECVRTPPDELLEAPLRMLGPGMRDKGITLIKEAAEELPMVEADRRAVFQVLVNLIGNSMKFTPSGGTITLGAVAEDRFVRFRVEDTGCGIPPDKLPMISQPFVQVEDHWKGGASGLGLGLAISRQLIERMGGAFQIESEYGRWTRVSFTLPCAASEEATSERPSVPAE